jgi:hypothetical protein
MYKSPATSYSFKVDDPQEIQERDLLMGHPFDYCSTDRWVPHLSDRHQGSQDQTLKKSTLRTNPKSWSSANPIQQELCQCQASILIQPITRKFNVILLSRLTRCQCCKHLIKPRFVSIINK